MDRYYPPGGGLSYSTHTVFFASISTRSIGLKSTTHSKRLTNQCNIRSIPRQKVWSSWDKNPSVALNPNARGEFPRRASGIQINRTIDKRMTKCPRSRLRNLAALDYWCPVKSLAPRLWRLVRVLWVSWVSGDIKALILSVGISIWYIWLGILRYYWGAILYSKMTPARPYSPPLHLPAGTAPVSSVFGTLLAI